MRASTLLVCALLSLGTHLAAARTAAAEGAPEPGLVKVAASRAAPAQRVAYRPRKPRLKSGAIAVVDQRDGNLLYAKNEARELPIASLTKLMTAMVIIDAGQPLDEPVTITKADKDTLRWSRSRLPVGVTLTRGELLRAALMASENRAAAALARTYPGGRQRFLAAMNLKAASLGMHHSTFVDATGLQSANTSTADDLVRMVRAALEYALIREITTTSSLTMKPSNRRREIEFRNTNYLVRRDYWDIGLSKTGYIKESGRCLVMQARIAENPVIIVLLNAQGKHTGFGDANRIRKWLEANTGS